MDSLIGLKGKDFVIIAADTINAYSVLRMKVSLPLPRTTMIKSGTSMGKNSSPLEENTPTSWSLEITSRKILLSCSTKMGINCPLMTPHSSYDLSSQRPSGKDPTASTASWPDSKRRNPDSTGSTTLAQSLRPARPVMDMLSFWHRVFWTLSSPKTWPSRKAWGLSTSAWTQWKKGSLSVSPASPSRLWERMGSRS